MRDTFLFIFIVLCTEIVRKYQVNSRNVSVEYRQNKNKNKQQQLIWYQNQIKRERESESEDGCTTRCVIGSNRCRCEAAVGTVRTGCRLQWWRSPRSLSHTHPWLLSPPSRQDRSVHHHPSSFSSSFSLQSSLVVVNLPYPVCLSVCVWQVGAVTHHTGGLLIPSNCTWKPNNLRVFRMRDPFSVYNWEPSVALQVVK